MKLNYKFPSLFFKTQLFIQLCLSILFLILLQNGFDEQGRHVSQGREIVAGSWRGENQLQQIGRSRRISALKPDPSRMERIQRNKPGFLCTYVWHINLCIRSILCLLRDSEYFWDSEGYNFVDAERIYENEKCINK